MKRNTWQRERCAKRSPTPRVRQRPDAARHDARRRSGVGLATVYRALAELATEGEAGPGDFRRVVLGS